MRGMQHLDLLHRFFIFCYKLYACLTYTESLTESLKLLSALRAHEQDISLEWPERNAYWAHKDVKRFFATSAATFGVHWTCSKISGSSVDLRAKGGKHESFSFFAKL